MPERMDVARAYEKSVRFLLSNPSFFIIALIPLVVQLVMNYTIGGLFTGIGPLITDAFSSGNITSFFVLIPSIVGSALIGLIVSLIVYPLVAGAYIIGTKQVLSNKRLDVIQVLKESFSKVLKLIIVTFLSGLLIGIGFMLLIIPGVILLIFLAYVIPVSVLENKGAIQTISHAMQVGKANVWNTILFFIIALLISSPLMFLDPISSSAISSLIITPITSIAYGITYIKVLKK